MLRIAAAIVAVPLMLVLLLAIAIETQDGRLGSLTAETFELGALPIVIVTALFMVAVFLPLLFLTSRFTKASVWSAVAIGFLSSLLPVLFGTWSILTDTRLRWGFRLERLADGFPWLVMGAVGGLLFWLLAIFRNRAFDQLGKKRS
jgi:hypothetical protein